MKNLKRNIKIAYIPFNEYGQNYTYDRRNILFYAKLKKIKIYKFDKKRKYDYLLLPPSFDITQIDLFKDRKEIIIGQLIDNYLDEQNFFKNYFRGIIKFLLGQQKYLTFNYKKNLIKYIKSLDFVLCASEIQKKNIKKYNKQVFEIFEGNFRDFNKIKKNFVQNNSSIISWEGRAENINGLRNFYQIFKNLSIKLNFEFHIFSDFYYSSFNGKFKKFSSILLIKKIFKELFSKNTTFAKSNIFFNQFSKNLTPKAIINSDLVIIPVRTDNNFYKGRSPNKLIMTMRMGIPVLCSNLPSYLKMSKEMGLNFCCSTNKEWEKKIYLMLTNKVHAKKISKKMIKFVNKNFNKNKFILQYDQVFSQYKK